MYAVMSDAGMDKMHVPAAQMGPHKQAMPGNTLPHSTRTQDTPCWAARLETRTAGHCAALLCWFKCWALVMSYAGMYKNAEVTEGTVPAPEDAEPSH